MPGRLIIAITLVFGLSACASRFNPLNWFQSSHEETIALIPEGGFPANSDQRLAISQITEMKVLRSSGGAIIQATGLPPRLGYWNAELVSDNNEQPENGVLTYYFRINQPVGASAAGTAYSRKVLVAHFVSNATLEGVRQIRIVAAENSRVARR